MAEVVSQQVSNKSTMIKWIITFIVPGMLFLVPTNELFTEQIRLFLFLTLFTIFILAFETLDYTVPGIMLPTLYALTGLVPMGVAFGAWASYLPWMIFGAAVLANIFIDTKFLTRVLYYCILKLGGKFITTCLALMLTSCLVSVLSGGMAVLLVVVLCYGLLQSFEIKPKSRESIFLMICATISFISCNCFVPVPATLAMLTAGGRMVDPAFTLSWAGFVMHNAPYILFLLFFTFLLYKILKPDVKADGKAYFQAEYAKLGSITLAEKKCAVVAAGLLIFLFTSSIHKIDVSWAFVIAPWILFLPGINVGTKKHIQESDIGIIIFAVMCVGIGVVSSALGFGQLFSQVMVPMLSNLSSSTFIFMVAIAGIVLNLLLTPMAVIGAFSGPFAQIATALGVNMLPVFYVLCSSMDQVFMPYEYMPYLLFFSYGFIRMGDFIKIFTLKMVLHLIFLMAVMVPWWKLIGVL